MSIYERKFNNKPILVVSKCLNFDKCRYNGEGDNNKFIEKLKDFVIFKPVCPEVEIGLSTPRNAIRLVKRNEEDSIRLIDPKTMKEYHDCMSEYADEFITSLQEVDGFILKQRSPSCGLKDVKVYSSCEKGASSKKGKGIFASKVLQTFPILPIEDDGRLRNFKIREHFLTKLYLMKDFKEIKKERDVQRLMNFHSMNKLLLMSYNQKQLKILGQILGKYDGENMEKLLSDYEEHLALALIRAPRYTSNINVLMRAMGYFSDKISHKEKEFILDTIEKYRAGKVPFSAPLYIIKTYIVRFEEKNLENQTFFQPFPMELVDISDSGKEERA